MNKNNCGKLGNIIFLHKFFMILLLYKLATVKIIAGIYKTLELSYISFVLWLIKCNQAGDVELSDSTLNPIFCLYLLNVLYSLL